MQGCSFLHWKAPWALTFTARPGELRPEQPPSSLPAPSECHIRTYRALGAEATGRRASCVLLRFPPLGRTGNWVVLELNSGDCLSFHLGHAKGSPEVAEGLGRKSQANLHCAYTCLTGQCMYVNRFYFADAYANACTCKQTEAHLHTSRHTCNDIQLDTQVCI